MVDILCEPKIVNIKNEVLCYSIKIQKTCFKPFLLIFHLFLVCIFFLLSNFNEYLQRRLFFVEADSVFFLLYLQGQSNEIFEFQLFSSFEPAWATDLRVKIFSILVNFSLRYSNFAESPLGMILRRVYLPGVSYPGESLF